MISACYYVVGFVWRNRTGAGHVTVCAGDAFGRIASLLGARACLDSEYGDAFDVVKCFCLNFIIGRFCRRVPYDFASYVCFFSFFINGLVGGEFSFVVFDVLRLIVLIRARLWSHLEDRVFCCELDY